MDSQRAGGVAFCEHGVAVGFGCRGCTERASVRCSTCDGRGYLTVMQADIPTLPDNDDKQVCPTCGGEGR